MTQSRPNTLALVLVLAALASSLTAQTAVVPPLPAAAPEEGSDTALPLEQRMLRRWQGVRASLASPTSEGLESRLTDLLKLREETRLRGFPGPAQALTVDGFRRLDEGDRETAEARFRAAIEVDPDAADARLGLAAVAWKKSPFSPGFLGALRDVGSTRMRSLRAAPFAQAGWFLRGSMVLLLLGWGVLFALMVRHQALLRHEVEEWGKSRTDRDLGGALGWILLLLPLVVSFDLYWAALWWAILLWRYFGLGEQVLAGIAVLALALAPAGPGLAARAMGGVNDPYISAATAFIEGFVDEIRLVALENYLSEKPDDRDAAILCALIYQKNNEQRAAVQYYRKLAAKGGDPTVLNNLGNAYYRLDEKDNALENWNKALAAKPDFAPTHYNLSLYYFSQFDFVKREEHFTRAKTVDPASVERWVRDGQGVVDAGIDPGTVRARLLAGGEGAPSTTSLLLSAQAIAALVAGVAGALLAFRSRKERSTAVCDRCGQAFCAACKPGKDKNQLCLQCVHLFLRKDGVSPQMRSDKLKAISRNHVIRKAVSTLAGTLAPGAGQIYSGRTLLGGLFLLLWAVPMGLWLAAPALPLEPGLVARAASVVPSILLLGAAALVWLLANVLNVVQRS